jgi:hypothetical protein
LPARRFPPPWSIDELEACFVVKDSAGQKLAYVYYEEEPGRRAAGQSAHERRSAQDCSRFCQAAGAVAQIKTAPTIAGAKRGVTDWSACMKIRHLVSQVVSEERSFWGLSSTDQ